MISPKLILGLACLMFFSRLVDGTYYQDLSSLEKTVVDEGMGKYGLLPLKDASGRVVKRIYVITASPFSPRAKYLTLLNYLHIDTKEYVIRRDIFQKTEEVFDEALVRDSELFLRSQGKVRSLAVIVPVVPAGPHKPGEVDLLVATTDILSLRPTFSFKGSGDTLTDLKVALGEHNFLGLNKSISVSYEYQQGGQIFGANYVDPRLLGSFLRLDIKPSIILQHRSFHYDGFNGRLSLERPLLSETDRYGYGLEATFGSKPVTDFRGSKIRTLDIPQNHGVKKIERYRYSYGLGNIYGTRSFGRAKKHEITLGYSIHVKRPSIPEEYDLTETDKEYLRSHYLPRDELESYITLEYAFFHNKFLTLYDYDNYKLQEKQRIGPAFSIANDFSSRKILLSDHDFIRPKLKMSWSNPIYQDGFFTVGASASIRYDGKPADAFYKLGFSIVSHKIFGLGRAVLDGGINLAFEDRDNQKYALGSDSGLRGVESRFYSGKKRLRGNFELRSVPIDIWIFHAGLVLFYDVGTAFDDWSKANATQALGFGIRVLAPQVSSVLFRLDLAFPISGMGKEAHTILPSFGTGQAF